MKFKIIVFLGMLLSFAALLQMDTYIDLFTFIESSQAIEEAGASTTGHIEKKIKKKKKEDLNGSKKKKSKKVIKNTNKIVKTKNVEKDRTYKTVIEKKSEIEAVGIGVDEDLPDTILIKKLRLKGRFLSYARYRKEVEELIEENVSSQQDKDDANNLLSIFTAIERGNFFEKKFDLLEKKTTSELFSFLRPWIINLNKLIYFKNEFSQILRNNPKIAAEKLEHVSLLCPKTPISPVTSYDRLLDKYFQKVCYKLFFESAEKFLPHISKNTEYDTVFSAVVTGFIKNNFKYIVNNKIYNFVLNHFIDQIIYFSQRNNMQDNVGYFLLHQKISDALSAQYIENNITPDPQILKRIVISSELTRFVQGSDFEKSNVQQFISRELKNLSSGVIGLLKGQWGQDVDESEVETKISQLLMFFELNKSELVFSEIYSFFSYMGKLLLNRGFYKSSEKIFKISLELVKSDKEYYEVIFYLIWINVFQGDYKYCEKIVNDYHLNEKLDKLPPRLIFWIAYSVYKLNYHSLAQKYFKKVIDLYPVSYYSIMSSKMMSNVNTEVDERPTERVGIPIKKIDGTNQQFLVPLIEENDKNVLCESLLSPKQLTNRLGTANVVKRIQLWQDIGSNFMTAVEINDAKKDIKNGNDIENIENKSI
ncbi:MAG: hypothetical protein HQK53_02795 [Oligoflexia bacterium]|nr:hypothetical protein [Oligoflexia bacterium]